MTWKRPPRFTPDTIEPPGALNGANEARPLADPPGKTPFGWRRRVRPLHLVGFATAFLATLSFHASRKALATTERENPYALLDQLGIVLHLIEGEYVDPVDRKALLEGAIEGMVEKLDPHSAYLPPEDYAIFQSDTEGRFGGVGVEVDFAEEWVTIIAPIEGSPADRASVKPGDRIIAIDHLSVRGKGPAELVRRMRGAPGSKVLLTISRPGLDKYLYFSLTREVIDVRSVASKVLVGGVGYLRIKAFQFGTHTELLQHVATLRKQSGGPPKGLILDLRNNPGGLVSEATAVADEFLGQGVVFTTRRRGRVVDDVRATAGGALHKITVVALVNEYTASSAELLGAALQDNRRASIVGASTFGKGSVQSIVDLPDGAGLRLTTLRYYSPSGRAIQAQGIRPDVAIPSMQSNFGVVREKNLDGHLPAEPGRAAETPDIPIDITKSGRTADVSLGAKEVPTDPRKGNDPALAVAYQMLTGALSVPEAGKAPARSTP